MKLRQLFICFCLFFAISCEESESPYSNVIRLLTDNDSKVWVTTSVESTEEPEGINCIEDNILTLQLFNQEKEGPAFTIDDGFVRCSFNFEETYSGSWRLNNAQTRIILTYGEGTARVNELYDIVELTGRKLILRNRSESYDDLTVTYRTITYESL